MSTIHTTTRPRPFREVLTDERVTQLAEDYRKYPELQHYKFRTFVDFSQSYVLLPHLNWKEVLHG